MTRGSKTQEDAAVAAAPTAAASSAAVTADYADELMETEPSEPEVKTEAETHDVRMISPTTLPPPSTLSTTTGEKRKRGKEEESVEDEKTKPAVEEDGRLANGKEERGKEERDVKKEESADPNPSSEKDSISVGGHNLRAGKTHHNVS